MSTLKGNPLPAESPTQSIALFERARRVIPGGVNSPVRAFRAVGGTPLFIARGRGAQVQDADGRRYLDFVGSWGPLILGHAHPEVVAAIVEAEPARHDLRRAVRGGGRARRARRGAYPGARAGALRLLGHRGGDERHPRGARVHRAAISSSSSPAAITATPITCWSRPARGSRPSAGRRRPACRRRSPPHPRAAARRRGGAAGSCSREGERIAAVIIEPVPANNGLLLQRREFLEALRRRDARARRAADLRRGDQRLPPGARRLPRSSCGITPDLATFGKIIGGGMPVGAFGGARHIMAHLAPEGDVYQAGTLSGQSGGDGGRASPTLDAARARARAGSGSRRSAPSSERMVAARPRGGAVSRCAWCARARCSGWRCTTAARTARGHHAQREEPERFASIFHAMLARGVYLPPSAYEVCFLSLAHTTADIEHFASALANAAISRPRVG